MLCTMRSHEHDHMEQSAHDAIVTAKDQMDL